jgi:glycolate oxidase subunit GlcD
LTLRGASTEAPGGDPSLLRELRSLVGEGSVLDGDAPGYAADESEGSGLRGSPDAVVLPQSTAEVARVVGWCYAHDVPLVPRGGGSGFAGGAVPLEGGVVLSLERMKRVLQLDPGLWRMRVEAGIQTAAVRRIARENGLSFPPDPGAAEQSHIGGNIATNAGGPHAFKYGVTGAWVTGLQAVVAPGEVIDVGGPIRKDVAGYDLKSLLIGSEGTLGVITAAWLRLIPAPEVMLPVVATYRGTTEGCDAIRRVLEAGIVPATLEYLDAGSLAASVRSLPGGAAPDAAFLVISEADGERAEAARLQAELSDVLRPGAVDVRALQARSDVEELWRWRDGVALAVSSTRGGKLSEDIVVPLDRLAEAIDATVEIGRRHRLEACSWGHAGDGNLHSTFLVDASDAAELERAAQAAEDLFDLAARLGGSISGEHGLGWLKRGQLERQWAPAALRLHEQVKEIFDPKGLLNPGKKLARLVA